MTAPGRPSAGARRLTGAGVLAAVLLVAAVLPGITGRSVAGSALAVPVEAAPEPGACAVALGPTANDDRSGAGDALGSAGDEMRYPTATFGPCTSSTVGEVVRVNDVFLPPERLSVRQYLSTSGSCVRAGDGAARLAVPPAGAATHAPVVWNLQVVATGVAIGPSSRQRAAGQVWTACLVTASSRQPYDGSVRPYVASTWDEADAAERRGPLPAAFGLCSARYTRPTTATGRVYRGSVAMSCADPHDAQTLGWAKLDRDGDGDAAGAAPAPTDAELQESCVTFAVAAVGTADPTFGGRLTVTGRWQAGGRSFAECRVAVTEDPAKPTGKLTGNVIGLGAGALPLAP